MSRRVFRLTDTLTRQKRELVCRELGHLRFYSCGPTVYNYAHIGNFRTFLTADLVVRTAEALGWKVTYVSNITDVGHLTQSDEQADAGGEDRMMKALRSEEGRRFVNIWELSEFYAKALVDDWDRLNLRLPYVRPKATQHMREQILAVQELEQKGHAYATELGVYFEVGTFPEYGKLSGNRDQEALRRAVREDLITDPGKRHPADFALWKRDERHLMQWYSPWGWGFPGWHIECSVMAMRYLGNSIDLHAGGEDLIFPHHECEIAQSEALTGEPFSNLWIHTRFLLVDGERMSKSKGNFYTVADLVVDRGADPLALRYALISQNYGTPHNFTLDLLRDATEKIERYRECDLRVSQAVAAARGGEDRLGATLDRLYQEALAAMCDDLNTSVALAKALEGTKLINAELAGMSTASAKSAQSFLERINGLLGIVRHDRPYPGMPCPGARADKARVDVAWVENKIAERAQAKKEKDFARADAIRQELAQTGIEVRDSPEGTTWRLKPFV